MLETRDRSYPSPGERGRMGGGERSRRFGSGRSWTPENQLPGGSRLSFLSERAACPAAGTAPTRRGLLLARRGLRLNPTGPRARETPGSLE